MKTYQGIIPAGELEIDENQIVKFEEKRVIFQILEKPKRVIACDDVEEVEIDIPAHLASDDYYLALNMETKRSFWLHRPSYQITELTL